jgi:hypothetical protein
MHMVVHGIEAGVRRRSLESKGGHARMEQHVPCTQSLFQPLDALE